MLLAKEFGCSVQVNGIELPVYDTSSPRPSAITGFIESKESQKFSVQVQSFQYSGSVAAEFILDGTSVECYLLNEQFTKAVADGIRGSEHLLSPFTFSTLTTTDDDDDEALCFDVNRIKSLGSIKVRIRRIASSSLVPAVRTYRQTNNLNGPINEKSKKGNLDSVVKFADAEYKPEVSANSYSCAYIDTIEEPYIEFDFQYRSRALLAALGHLPSVNTLKRSQPSSSAKVKAELPSYTIPKQIPYKAGEIVDLCDDDDDDPGPSFKRVKREVKEVERIPYEKGEVVDLCGEDDEVDDREENAGVQPDKSGNIMGFDNGDGVAGLGDRVEDEEEAEFVDVGEDAESNIAQGIEEEMLLEAGQEDSGQTVKGVFT